MPEHRPERMPERTITGLTLDRLDDLPRRCRSCVFWELEPSAGERAAAAGTPGLEKEAWLSATLLRWGSCGRVAYVGGVPAGYALYAPPWWIPRSELFPTGPASPDAVLLMTLRVLPQFAGQGLGRMLVQGVAAEAPRHGVHAVEAFGDATWTAPTCVLPADFLLAVGFKTVRPHHRFPRLRLDVPGDGTWDEEAEARAALDRLLSAIQRQPELRTV